jgi:hypothetical protein
MATLNELFQNWATAVQPTYQLLKTYLTAANAALSTTSAVTPEQYGAVGDGVTDDLAAFKAMDTAIATAGVFANVSLGPKIYILGRDGGNAWCWKPTANNFQITGQPGRSWLKAKPGLPAISIALIKIEQNKNIRLSGVGIDGNWGNAVTFVTQGSNALALSGTYTLNVDSTSDFASPTGTIFVKSTTGIQTVTYTGTTATSFTGCTGGSGVVMRNYPVGLQDGNAGINHGDQGADPQNYALALPGAQNIWIDHCYFQDTYGDFIWLGASSSDHTKWSNKVFITNCIGDISAWNGVTFGSGVTDVVIDSCKWTNVWDQAVDGEPGSYPIRNIVIQNSTLGAWWNPEHGFGPAPISIVGSDNTGYALPGAAALNWRVENNIIQGAVYIEYAQDIVLKGNKITADFGVASKSIVEVALGSGDITIDDNEIYARTSISGAAQAGVGAITVYNYTALGPNGGTEVFNPATVRITKNKIKSKNGRHGINIVAAGGHIQATSGTATGITATTLTDSGAVWTPDAFGGCVVRVGTAEMTILNNTATVLTGQTVDNSFTTGWETETGNYAPTPSVGTYVITRRTGTVEVDHNDIDCGDDGNGAGGNGIFLTQLTSQPGTRVRITDNKVKNATTDGIFIEWSGSVAVDLLDLSRNHIWDDQATPTTTNAIGFRNVAPNATKWVMGGNIKGDGVTNMYRNLSSGVWLVSDGQPQVWAGFGAPGFTAPKGSTYQRLDGGAGTTFYVNEAGTSTWAAK